MRTMRNKLKRNRDIARSNGCVTRGGEGGLEGGGGNKKPFRLSGAINQYFSQLALTLMISPFWWKFIGMRALYSVHCTPIVYC